MLPRKGHVLFVVLAVIMLFGLGQVASAQVEVNVMPDSDIRPYAWVGRNLPVWGNVTGGVAPYTYEWAFGDATPNASGAVSDPKHILVGHTYAAAGTYFATLTVTDNVGASDSDMVRIRVLPGITIDAQVSAAVQDGLRYLYLNQRANGSWSGSWYASYAYVGGTGIAVLAFEEQGCLPSDDPTEYIYSDCIQAGLDYMFMEAVYQTVDAASDTHNGNGQGVRFETPYTHDIRRPTYEVGIAMMAIVATGTPGEIITVGPLAGQTYQYAIEEATDWCAFAQNDSGYYGGGWRYTDNYGSSDNSVSQWPAIGLEAAETMWGTTTPAFVKDRLLNNWLVNTQHPTNGGFGYAGTDTNMARSGGGFCELAYCDVPASDSRVQNVLGYLANGWLWTGYSGNRNNLYAMYGIAKGARTSLPPVTMIGGRDWQDDYNDWLVADQNYSLSGGSWWSSAPYGSNEGNTGFAVLVLSPGVFELPPVADAGPNQDMPSETDIDFDGSGSYHQNPNESIVAWEWDIDDSDGVSFNPPDLTGSEPTLVGGYPELGFDYPVVVTLRVTGSGGLTDTDTVLVNITSANVPPIADAGGPYYGEINQLITFDGSASYDPNEGPPLNDSIVSWEWDMDGDGQYDDASGETVQWSWPTSHSGVIGLKVTDSFGASGTASAEYTTIAVSELWIVEYRWSTQTVPPYTMTVNPDGSIELEASMGVRIENRGNGDAFNVTATLVDVPDNVTILDGDLSFGDVGAKKTEWSEDDFGIRIISTGPADNTVWWDIEWDDAAGSHHIMVNVPMFGP